MIPMRFCWLSLPKVLYLSMTLATFGSEPYDMASYHPSVSSYFDAGAGQGYDGTLYDNKQAQTFAPSESGFIGSVSISVYRMTDTTAPLRIRITDTLGGIPNSTLSETYINPSEVPTSLQGKPYLNVTGTFDAATLLLEAGQQYALVFDSTETEANYRIQGSSQYEYANGIRFKSQNSSVWTAQTLGDYFFQVQAKRRSEIQTISFPADDDIQLDWTHSLGRIWIDQSTNLVDWLPICGPLTDTNIWTGPVDIEDLGFFRIRQTE